MRNDEVGSPSGSVPRLGAGAFFDDDEKREIGMERAEVEAPAERAQHDVIFSARSPENSFTGGKGFSRIIKQGSKRMRKGVAGGRL